MTTPAAEKLYLAQHQHEMEGKRNVIFNPYNKPIEELPLIMGFNNGGSPGWYYAVAMAEDGTCLGSHCCSAEGYMPHDLGVLEGTMPDRHEKDYQKHYPNGYRMVFISYEDVPKHAILQIALDLNRKKGEEAKRLEEEKKE